MTVKVTVGVCVKNSENIVKRALESISNQDFPHKLMELIIVDDGSTDGTYSVLRDFAVNTDIRTKIIRSGGKGLAFSRQLVVDDAEGNYVVWVDGDHQLPIDFVTKHVQFMDGNPDVAIACGNEIFQGVTLVALLESMSISLKNRLAKTAVDVGGGIFRVRSIKEVGGFDTGLKGAGEDVEITNRMKKLRMKIARDGVEFCHHHRTTWRALWNEYFWWGYGMHYVNHKQELARFPSTRIPVLSYLVGVRLSVSLYRTFSQKKAFLLPFQYLFKNLGFCLGYAKSHLNRYGH